MSSESYPDDNYASAPSTSLPSPVTRGLLAHIFGPNGEFLDPRSVGETISGKAVGSGSPSNFPSDQTWIDGGVATLDDDVLASSAVVGATIGAIEKMSVDPSDTSASTPAPVSEAPRACKAPMSRVVEVLPDCVRSCIAEMWPNDSTSSPLRALAEWYPEIFEVHHECIAVRDDGELAGFGQDEPLDGVARKEVLMFLTRAATRSDMGKGILPRAGLEMLVPESVRGSFGPTQVDPNKPFPHIFSSLSPEAFLLDFGAINAQVAAANKQQQQPGGFGSDKYPTLSTAAASKGPSIGGVSVNDKFSESKADSRSLASLLVTVEDKGNEIGEEHVGGGRETGVLEKQQGQMWLIRPDRLPADAPNEELYAVSGNPGSTHFSESHLARVGLRVSFLPRQFSGIGPNPYCTDVRLIEGGDRSLTNMRRLSMDSLGSANSSVSHFPGMYGTLVSRHGLKWLIRADDQPRDLPESKLYFAAAYPPHFVHARHGNSGDRVWFLHNIDRKPNPNPVATRVVMVDKNDKPIVFEDTLENEKDGVGRSLAVGALSAEQNENRVQVNPHVASSYFKKLEDALIAGVVAGSMKDNGYVNGAEVLPSLPHWVGEIVRKRWPKPLKGLSECFSEIFGFGNYHLFMIAKPDFLAGGDQGSPPVGDADILFYLSRALAKTKDNSIPIASVVQHVPPIIAKEFFRRGGVNEGRLIPSLALYMEFRGNDTIFLRPQVSPHFRLKVGNYSSSSGPIDRNSLDSLAAFSEGVKALGVKQPSQTHPAAVAALKAPALAAPAPVPHNLQVTPDVAILIGAVAGSIETTGQRHVFGATSFKNMPGFVVSLLRSRYPKRPLICLCNEFPTHFGLQDGSLMLLALGSVTPGEPYEATSLYFLARALARNRGSMARAKLKLELPAAVFTKLMSKEHRGDPVSFSPAHFAWDESCNTLRFKRGGPLKAEPLLGLSTTQQAAPNGIPLNPTASPAPWGAQVSLTPKVSPKTKILADVSKARSRGAAGLKASADMHIVDGCFVLSDIASVQSRAQTLLHERLAKYGVAELPQLKVDPEKLRDLVLQGGASAGRARNAALVRTVGEGEIDKNDEDAFKKSAKSIAQEIVRTIAMDIGVLAYRRAVGDTPEIKRIYCIVTADEEYTDIVKSALSNHLDIEVWSFRETRSKELTDLAIKENSKLRLFDLDDLIDRFTAK